jgi:hypothetical protein
VSQVIFSDHFPIILDLGEKVDKPKVPFKFNPSCLEDNEFKEIVSTHWKHYDSLL